jgi:hypothetical protein
MKIIPYTVLFFLFLLIPSVYSQNDIQTMHHKKKSVVWLDNAAFIVDHKNKSVRELYSDMDNAYYITETADYTVKEVEKMIANGSDPEYWEGETKYMQQEFNNMLSIVGPYISYQSDYYYEGGAHPSYGTGFLAYNMKTDTVVRLQDIFDEKDILDALQKDEFIQKYLTAEKYYDYNTLKSLFDHLDGECAYYFSMDNLSHFAFHHVKEDMVGVRIGISYGCEAMRGNFTQIGIYLPMNRKFKKMIKKAIKNNVLMKDLVLE